MRPAGKLALGVLALTAGSTAVLAQSAVISARSGLIHYVEGQVYVDDQPVETKFGVFPEVKENQQLKTEEGRAEVLLTPGVFLRLGENSSFRMVTNRLIDTRLEFLSGSAVVEAEDILKDNSTTVVYGDTVVHPTKKGVYRFDAAAKELRVYDGEAEVAAGDQTVEVKEGHLIALDTLAVHKFDKTAGDALNRWSERRDQYVSMANVAPASTLRNSMFDAGNSLPGGWYWNSLFGMYSYVPGMGGMFYSPYGYAFFSPFDVGMAYMPGFYYPGYYGGYNGYSAPGYGGAYNAVSYKSVPVPGSVASGSKSSGSAGSSHGPSTGGGSLGSIASNGGYTSPVASAPISHGGGAVGGGGSTGGGGHH
jgi:hypothetical protein